MKEALGIKNCLYPMPVTLVGAEVAGKANHGSCGDYGPQFHFHGHG